MRRENGVNTIFDEKTLNNIFEKCIFDKIIAEQWSTWRMKQISKYRKDRGSKKYEFKVIRHIIIKMAKFKDKENSKSRKKKKSCTRELP